MMFAEERKLKILEFIEEHKKATVAQLCEHFTVSSATIRNDLRDLESANLLIRTHGGAMVKSKTGFELDSNQKKVRNLDKKRKIAEATINLIEDGDTVILDTGTTTIELAKLLQRKRDITVVTNDLGITLLLEDVDSVNIVFMGGIVRKHFHCTVTYGTTGKDTLSGLTVNKAFMGVNSFCMKKGATTPDINQAETKKLMISIATNVILLCDSTKFGNTSFAQFATLDQIDTIITDSIDAKDYRKLEESGIDVIVAS
ncbi:MAG TPA: DeoR/GlpR family DNA-binding transcription regulator [Spirochaetia bacterium]|nr:DeoR/GlpR family DNA-binding transcription regulator [Spirochaetia bacterium]